MLSQETVTKKGIIDRLESWQGLNWTFSHGTNLPKQPQYLFVDE